MNRVIHDAGKQGFSVIATGGGCEALQKEVGDHTLMITGEAAVPARMSDGCILLVCDRESGEHLVMFTLPSLKKALELAGYYTSLMA